MRRFVVIVLCITAFVIGHESRGAETPDYTQGVFIVNEDWYGHHNSTINYLKPDDPDGEYWSYRVFQTENPGYELGCTNQFGAIWNDRFYLIAKQEKDPGTSITGGRITVADANTMKVIKQLELIDPSGNQCDGRGFIGVDEHKGYISSSNGVWIFNLDALEVTAQIPGTANPNVGDNLPNTNPGSSLYFGQTGSMVESGGHIFIAHQSAGVIIVDPTIDEVVTTLTFSEISEKASVGSVVVSKDGTVWASVAKDSSGSGATEPYIVKIDPQSFEMTIMKIPEGICAPANSWYAWTPDGFCASSVRNALYWNGGANSWFSQQNIYRYDIDADTYTHIIDLNEQGEGWNLYGCSMRLHPVTDDIYMSLFVKFANTTYTLRRCDYMGNTIKEYPMIANYWFPSIPVFPESKANSVILPSTDDSFTIVGNSINITGRGPDIKIYTIGGTHVATFSGSNPGTRCLTLQQGVYIITDGLKTMKVSI